MKNIYAKQEAILWAEQRGVDAQNGTMAIFTVHCSPQRESLL
jgi:hypothetical protein